MLSKQNVVIRQLQNWRFVLLFFFNSYYYFCSYFINVIFYTGRSQWWMISENPSHPSIFTIAINSFLIMSFALFADLQLLLPAVSTVTLTLPANLNSHFRQTKCACLVRGNRIYRARLMHSFSIPPWQKAGQVETGLSWVDIKQAARWQMCHSGESVGRVHHISILYCIVGDFRVF